MSKTLYRRLAGRLGSMGDGARVRGAHDIDLSVRRQRHQQHRGGLPSSGTSRSLNRLH